ncbi:MAG: hypothetical protein V2A58_08570 [Planctomycetota bacterium]
MGSATRPEKKVKAFLAVVAWAAATAAGAAVLGLLLEALLNRSLALTRGAVIALLAGILGVALAELHRAARGKPGLVFLMRVVLGMVCLMILVLAWGMTTGTGRGTGEITFFNNSEQDIQVKVSLVEPSGAIGDEVYSFEVGAGARRKFRFERDSSSASYAVLMSSLRAPGAGTWERSTVGRIVGSLGILSSVGEPFYRRIFPAKGMPRLIVASAEGGQLGAVEDPVEEDLYTIPLPTATQPQQ